MKGSEHNDPMTKEGYLSQSCRGGILVGSQRARDPCQAFDQTNPFHQEINKRSIDMVKKGQYLYKEGMIPVLH
jgi:hypothetical protein